MRANRLNTQNRPGVLPLAPGSLAPARAGGRRWRLRPRLPLSSRRTATMQAGIAPPVEWDAGVDQHMHWAFGAGWADIKLALSTPPSETCVRVNTMQTTPQEAMMHLQELLGPSFEVQQHPVISTAVMVRGTGHRLNIDYSVCGGKEVVVTRRTGEAMMKGADLYAPGVLACSAGVSANDLVAVSIALEEGGSLPFTRGTTLQPNASMDLTASGRQLLGIGKAVLGRIEMFRVSSGLAVTMQQRVHDSPPLNGVLPGAIMLQHLPSIVAAMALAPHPGSRVLDMCAAPGGKTTVLAQLMGDRGEVVAFDRTHVKAEHVRALAAEQGFTCIKAFKQDALKAVAMQADASCTTTTSASSNAPEAVATQAPATSSSNQSNQQMQAEAADTPSPNGAAAPTGNDKVMQRQARKLAAMARHGHIPTATTQHLLQQPDGPVCSGYPPNSFDYVLLDAPCTATGLRPRLVQALDMPLLQRTAAYQRQLLDVAVQLLKPGGCLVYSTCSIAPDENECNVRYVLDRYPCMRLVPQPCYVGGRGMAGPADVAAVGMSGSSGNVSLSEDRRRAQAAAANGDSHGSEWLPADKAALLQRFDPRGPYIGFFCAKFCKKAVGCW